MSFSLRALTPADQPAWREMRLEALREFPTAFLTTYDEQRTRPAADDRAMLARGAWRGLFADAQMIGIGAFIRHRQAAAAHRADIGAIYVSQAHWGRGAGQFMMDGLEREARTAGLLQLELSVAANNTRAIRFYEHCGFVRFGTQPRAIIIDGVGYDDYFYVKHLDQVPA